MLVRVSIVSISRLLLQQKSFTFYVSLSKCLNPTSSFLTQLKSPSSTKHSLSSPLHSVYVFQRYKVHYLYILFTNNCCLAHHSYNFHFFSLTDYVFHCGLTMYQFTVMNSISSSTMLILTTYNYFSFFKLEAEVERD